MSTDFGAEMDAALKGHIEAIRSAAGAAKERIDEGIAGVPAEPDPIFAAPPSAHEAPTFHAAAVDFNLDEVPLEFDRGYDAEGIPSAEEI